MTRLLSVVLATILLFTALIVPVSTSVSAITPTTTTAFMTTTSTWVWECDSTTPPLTTTTTYVLTGPGGINPDYTTYPPTTTTTEWGCISTPPPTFTTTCPPVNGEVDLLTESDVEAYGNISVLAYPTEEFGMCADCYTNSGAELVIYPHLHGPWDASTARYLHMTVRTNMPFTVTLNSRADTPSWFAAAAGTDEVIPAGGYRFVIDLYEYEGRPASFDLTMFEFMLHAAGSISIGHISLSNDPVCDKPIPNIQTTTKPSFPWDSTTTTTLILTGPDGISTTTLPPTSTVCYTSTTTAVYTTTTTTTAPFGTTSTTLWPPTTTSAPPVYTSGTPISSTRPTGNPTTNDALVPGDMNNDGVLSMVDAFTLYRGVSTGDWSRGNYANADYTGDGVLDIRDAFILYKYVSGQA